MYLVGAGPGDVNLLTLKAADLLKNYADVVIRDRLISQDILDLIPQNTEVIFAGKEPDFHHMKQDEINSALVRYALDGRKVVRLKGGDPFIFGRGGEEIEELQKHQLEYEVVPGVTACLSAASVGSVPLTYRAISDGMYVVSGHNYEGQEPKLDYNALAKGNITIVLYMGTKNMKLISDRLIEHGMSPKTPVYAIQNASMVDQNICLTSLEEASKDFELSDIKNPAIIVIGEVAKKAQI